MQKVGSIAAAAGATIWRVTCHTAAHVTQVRQHGGAVRGQGHPRRWCVVHLITAFLFSFHSCQACPSASNASWPSWRPRPSKPHPAPPAATRRTFSSPASDPTSCPTACACAALCGLRASTPSSRTPPPTPVSTTECRSHIARRQLRRKPQVPEAADAGARKRRATAGHHRRGRTGKGGGREAFRSVKPLQCVA